MGPPLAVLMVMIYIDKDLFSRLKYQADFGIELQTLSSVLAGIIYGPFFGIIKYSIILINYISIFFNLFVV